jgi:hypothetical protein
MKRGYITAAALAFFTIFFFYLVLILSPPINARSFANQRLRDVQESYLEKAALTRVLTALKNNISYSLSPNYPDLKKSITVTEISSEKPVIHTSAKSFDIYSATEIHITAWAKTSQTVTLYSPSGEIIFSETVEGSRSWTIGNIYDPATDTFGYGYGTYRIEGGDGVDITYQETQKRILQIDRWEVEVTLNPGTANIIKFKGVV